MIYLKLRREYLLYKAEQMHEQIVILSENNRHFLNFFSFTLQLISSQFEINHVIQEPTEVN